MSDKDQNDVPFLNDTESTATKLSFDNVAEHLGIEPQQTTDLPPVFDPDYDWDKDFDEHELQRIEYEHQQTKHAEPSDNEKALHDTVQWNADSQELETALNQEVEQQQQDQDFEIER